MKINSKRLVASVLSAIMMLSQVSALAYDSSDTGSFEIINSDVTISDGTDGGSVELIQADTLEEEGDEDTPEFIVLSEEIIDDNYKIQVIEEIDTSIVYNSYELGGGLVTLKSTEKLVAGTDFEYFLYDMANQNSSYYNGVVYIRTSKEIEITNSKTSSKKIKIVLEGALVDENGDEVTDEAIASIEDAEEEYVRKANIVLNNVYFQNDVNYSTAQGTTVSGETDTYAGKLYQNLLGMPGGKALTSSSPTSRTAVAVQIYMQQRFLGAITVGVTTNEDYGISSERTPVEATIKLKGDNVLIGGPTSNSGSTGLSGQNPYFAGYTTGAGIQVTPVS